MAVLTLELESEAEMVELGHSEPTTTLMMARSRVFTPLLGIRSRRAPLAPLPSDARPSLNLNDFGGLCLS